MFRYPEDRIQVGVEIFHTHPDRPCEPFSLQYNVYGVFCWGYGGRGVALITYHM